MKVAFYLDIDLQEHVALAKRAIEAARAAMPEAEIWHLTTPDGPELPADECLRLDLDGGFGVRRATINSTLSGEVLFLDVDVIVQEDVSDVFDDKSFDVAVTTDIRPGSNQIKYNGGVVFSRNSVFWAELAERFEGLEFRHWHRIEARLTQVADSGLFNVKVLPGEQYNYVPRRDETNGAKIVHYRGGRKKRIL